MRVENGIIYLTQEDIDNIEKGKDMLIKTLTEYSQPRDYDMEMTCGPYGDEG